MSILLQVGNLTVDPQQQIIFRNGQPVEMPELSIKLFMSLLQAAPNCISKDKLLNQVWTNTVTTPESLKVRVSLLRKSLAAEGDDHHYIQTVRNEGYKIPLEISSYPPSPRHGMTPTMSCFSMVPNLSKFKVPLLLLALASNSVLCAYLMSEVIRLESEITQQDNDDTKQRLARD